MKSNTTARIANLAEITQRAKASAVASTKGASGMLPGHHRIQLPHASDHNRPNIESDKTQGTPESPQGVHELDKGTVDPNPNPNPDTCLGKRTVLTKLDKDDDLGE